MSIYIYICYASKTGHSGAHVMLEVVRVSKTGELQERSVSLLERKKLEFEADTMTQQVKTTEFDC